MINLKIRMQSTSKQKKYIIMRSYQDYKDLS